MDSANRQRIELLFNRSQSQQLLLDLTGSQALAAVFSEPASHRTLQIKGSEIHPGVVDDAKLSLVKTAGERFANALLELGYNKAFTLSLLSCRPAELVAVSFLPQALFEQSPGPAAGNPVVVA